MTGCLERVVSDNIYEVVEPGTLAPGDPIPLPQADAFLTISGKIGTTNQGDGIVMNRDILESVGVVEYDVHDPFEDRSIVFRGVLMSDLLGVWQVSDEAEVARFTALNDYRIDVPIDDFYQYPVLLALQADGAYMTPDYRGPAMLVYPLNDYEFDLVGIKRKWIWQIKSIEFQ
jgi:hypothetical protein